MSAAAPRHTAPVSVFERWIGAGLMVLVAIMPFHAFLSVWLGHLTGHEALWESWKELLLAILAVVGLAAVWQAPRLRRRLSTPIVYTIAAFVGLALLVTLVARPPHTAALFGLKTDLEFLLAFLLALLVGSQKLAARLQNIIVATSGAVIGFGLLQIYALPHDWLMRFGYGPATVQPYETVSNALHTVRIIATLGGANQLGSFLVLPLCLVVWRLMTQPRWWQPLYLIAGAIVMWHTYSRSALLGLAAGVLLLGLIRVAPRWRLPMIAAVVAICVLGWLAATSLAHRNAQVQFYLFHQSATTAGDQGSTNLHALATSQGLQTVLRHPLGEGLGTAGPASYHGPHPFIPEDYYLQLAFETGIVGLALFVAIEILVSWQLWRQAVAKPRPTPGAAGALAALLGISVINLFLHGWADSSTALVYWSFAGTLLGAVA